MTALLGPQREAFRGWLEVRSLHAPVRLTSGRIAIPPTCSGHIPRSDQAKICTARRSEPPIRFFGDAIDPLAGRLPK